MWSASVLLSHAEALGDRGARFWDLLPGSFGLITDKASFAAHLFDFQDNTFQDLRVGGGGVFLRISSDSPGPRRENINYSRGLPGQRATWATRPGTLAKYGRSVGFRLQGLGAGGVSGGISSQRGAFRPVGALVFSGCWQRPQHVGFSHLGMLKVKDCPRGF